MNTIQIRLYDLFRNEISLSDEKDSAFVSAVEEVVENEVRKDSNIHSSKEDIYRLELKIEQTKSDLELKMEQNKTDLYKAIFWNWTGAIYCYIGRGISNRKVY